MFESSSASQSIFVSLEFYASSFTAAYNAARFAKPPKSVFNAHRPLRDDEDVDAILTWRVLRKVSDSLTVLNDRVIYLLEETEASRKLIGRYIDVGEYPDGRMKIQANGVALPYLPYDKLFRNRPGRRG